jgi:hypothetical protein
MNLQIITFILWLIFLIKVFFCILMTFTRNVKKTENICKIIQYISVKKLFFFTV